MTNIFDRMALNDDPENRQNELAFADQVNRAVPPENPDEPARTSPSVKAIVQELLRQGHIEEGGRQDLFRRIIVNQPAIDDALEPLDLCVRIDTHRGVAFLAVACQNIREQDSAIDEVEDNGWSHPLVRKQRLTLEQSLLVAILRQAFVMHEQESGVGQSPASIAIDDLLPIYLTYVGESGSDSRDENRLLQLLEQLKIHGIVSEVDSKHEVTIRPLIAHLASPESLLALLTVVKQKVQEQHSAEENT